MDYQSLLCIAVHSSLKSGDAILEIYDSDFSVEKKSDDSPLTLADKKSHNIISTFLGKSDIPILSEEGREIPFKERSQWNIFWLVDPLDGTKEFIKRNGEFTINIALVENQYPIAGVIYVPYTGELYFANKNEGSYKYIIRQDKMDFNSFYKLKKISNKLPLQKSTSKYTVVGSRPDD